MNARQARESLQQLQQDLKSIAAKNPDVSVDTTVLEALLASSGDWAPEGHPVVLALKAKLPLGELPAKNALLIAGQLYAAIPAPGINIA